nr:ribonuclease H-like domain-containing protein [Tanacetum cinerariifolium]
MDSNFNNKNKPWEYSLDINDFDLHLTPAVRSSSSIHVEPSPYTTNPDPDEALMSAQQYMDKVVEDFGDDDDFKSAAWVSASNYVNAFGGIVTGCLGDVDNFLKKRKLEQIVGIVKSCSPNMLGDLNVTLKDLSGILQLVLLGLEDRHRVPNWILRLTNDRDGWDKRDILGAVPCVLPSAFSTMDNRDPTWNMDTVTSPSPTPQALHSVSPGTWHQRLGHIGEEPNPWFHGQTSHIYPLPKSPSIALSDPHWRDAMYDKYNALIKNGTCILVPKPPNVNVIRSMWLFRHKYHADGSLSKYKARLVANGRNQQYEVDCGDTFSPVVKPSIIRIVLSLALAWNWPVHQLDVKNVFLNDLGDLNYFLGISVTRDARGMFLSQKKHVMELLECAHVSNCNATRTPVDTESKLGSDRDPISDSTLYCSLTGGLQYLTFTRPDISYAEQDGIFCLGYKVRDNKFLGIQFRERQGCSRWVLTVKGFLSSLIVRVHDKQRVKRMASINTRLNIKKLYGNIIQKHGGSKQVGFKQLTPGVETGVHEVHDEKRVWFEVELQGAQGDHEAEVFQVYTQCMKSEVVKHLGVPGILQQNGLVNETYMTFFAKGFFSWLASNKQEMLEPVKVKCIFLGYRKGVEFEVEPQKDHTFEVEPHGNVDPVVGSQEVQTQDLMEYQLASDRDQHLACELFGYKEDDNEAAFAVAASDVYVLSKGCRKCSDNSDDYYWEYTQGMFIHLFLYIDDMVFSYGCKVEIWATKGLLDKAKRNVLGMEIVRDQSGNTLRVS